MKEVRSMHNLDELLSRIKKRVTDPVRFLDAAAWVRPLRKIGALATPQDIDDAERLLGFSFPIVVRRMYTEIGNGSWGPHYGFYPILLVATLVGRRTLNLGGRSLASVCCSQRRRGDGFITPSKLV